MDGSERSAVDTVEYLEQFLMSGSCHRNEDVWLGRPGGPIRLPLRQQPQSLPWISSVAECYMKCAETEIAKMYVKDLRLLSPTSKYYEGKMLIVIILFSHVHDINLGL